MPFRFETLTVWKEARAFSGAVYKLTERFPRHEAFGLASQLNRAGNAAPLLIAEGSALPTKLLFHHRLGLAQGEIAEVICGTLLALDRKYVDQVNQTNLYQSGQSLARQLDKLRQTLR